MATYQMYAILALFALVAAYVAMRLTKRKIDEVPCLLYDGSRPRWQVEKLPIKKDKIKIKNVKGFKDQDVPVADGFGHDTGKGQGYFIDTQTGQLMRWMGRERSIQAYRNMANGEQEGGPVIRIDVGDPKNEAEPMEVAPLRVDGEFLREADEDRALKELAQAMNPSGEFIELLRSFEPVLTLLSAVISLFVLIVLVNQFGWF